MLKLDFGLSRLQSHGMAKFVIPILALGIAVIAATALGTLAHDGLGIHRHIIGIGALASAAIVGCAMAGNAWLRRNK